MIVMHTYKRIDGRLSDAAVDDVVHAVVVSNRQEGIDTPVDEIEMLSRYGRGEVTKDQYKQWILDKAGIVS